MFYKLNGCMNKIHERIIYTDSESELSSVCRLSEVNSVFYEINYVNRSVFCYNKRGNLKET